MRILVDEDDEFKAADLLRILMVILPDATVTRAASVTSALRAISSNRFDLIVLDMSLPTFDLSGPGGGGSPQGQGGIELLRLARRINVLAQYIIVTQFPDIEIGLFDVSSGMEDVEHGVDGRAEQVDDAREGSGVAIASGASAGCLEQPIERFEAGIGMA